MRRLLGVTVLGTLILVGKMEVPSRGAVPHLPARDTTRTPPPLQVRNSTFFETKYLARAADVAMEKYRESEDPSRGASASSEEARARAATLAKRYGVAPVLAEKIVDVALAEGIDPELGFRMIRVESGFEPRARGARGATGLLQLMPSTARSVDRSVDTRQELYDPATNLRVGFRYLRQMIERYDGNVRLGILAYNRGEIAVDRALKGGRDPENGYSHKVLGTRGSRPYTGRGLVNKSQKK